jgi:hypothetical protein
MVKHLAALIVVLFAAGLLAGCGFFLASPFPQYLAQVTHQRSLSDYLPDLTSGQVTLKVMNNGSTEFLFLVYLPPIANARLLVLDEQLGIVSQYEDDRSTSTNRLGNLLLVQPTGTFVAGTIIIDATGQIVGPYSALSGYEYNLGFYTGAPDFRFFDPSSRTTSDHTQMSLLFAPTPITGVPLSSTGASYSLHRLFHDMTAGTVAFYFKKDLTWRIEGVLRQASTFNTDYNTLYNPFFSNPTYFTIDNVDLESVHYTRDGTVIRSMEEDGGRRKMKLVGFDGTVKAEFPEYRNRTAEAYAAEGDHYYFLDLEERILYRANTWW